MLSRVKCSDAVPGPCLRCKRNGIQCYPQKARINREPKEGKAGTIPGESCKVQDTQEETPLPYTPDSMSVSGDCPIGEDEHAEQAIQSHSASPSGRGSSIEALLASPIPATPEQYEADVISPATPIHREETAMGIEDVISTPYLQADRVPAVQEDVGAAELLLDLAHTPRKPHTLPPLLPHLQQAHEQARLADIPSALSGQRFWQPAPPRNPAPMQVYQDISVFRSPGIVQPCANGVAPPHRSTQNQKHHDMLANGYRQIRAGQVSTAQSKATWTAREHLQLRIRNIMRHLVSLLCLVSSDLVLLTAAEAYRIGNRLQ